jgi:Putative phage metallopeptidase
MAVRELEPDKPPRHVGGAAKKIGDAARKGKLVDLNKKPLRPGQRHRTRTRKPRVVTTFSEATDVQARADRIIGADVWRLRALAQARILYLFTSTERVSGCMGGVVRASRYPRIMRWKTALKYEFLVLVARPVWDGRTTDEEKTQLVYHALRHLGSDTAGRWKVEAHDHTGFYSEVEFFGTRSPEVKRIAEQLDLFGYRTAQKTDNGKEERTHD